MIEWLRLFDGARFRIQPFGPVSAGREFQFQVSLSSAVDVDGVGLPRFGQDSDGRLGQDARALQPAPSVI